MIDVGSGVATTSISPLATRKSNTASGVAEGEVMYNKLETVVSRYLKLPVSYLGIEFCKILYDII